MPRAIKKAAPQEARRLSAAKGVVTALFLCPVRHGQLARVEQVKAIIGHGLEGDCHTKRRVDAPNQVLVMDEMAAREQGFKPGDLREQVTVDFPELHQLPPGSLFHIGQVTLQISGHCVPCKHIGERLGAPDPEALRKSLEKRRGMLCSVVSVDGDGFIRVGDAVDVLMVETEAAVVSL
jgi:hypothetical protein